MDKKHHPRRQKGPGKDDLADESDSATAAAPEETPDTAPNTTPRGASFDTEEGRAAQGMRADLGGDPDAPPAEMESGMGGASDGSSGGGDPAGGKGAASGITGGGTDIRTDGRFDKGDVEEDRKKIFPEAKAKSEK